MLVNLGKEKLPWDTNEYKTLSVDQRNQYLAEKTKMDSKTVCNVRMEIRLFAIFSALQLELRCIW
jgi:hypothetical protein